MKSPRTRSGDHSEDDLPSRIQDPRTELTPTARRVLEATRQVILNEGLAKLTLSRISKVSGGKNVAAVKYYFGNKSGLVSVVLDTVLFDVVSTLDVPPSETLTKMDLGRLALQSAIVNQPSDALRILFEMLPLILRDSTLLGRVHAYYEAFYQLHLTQLRSEVEQQATDSSMNQVDEPRASLEGLASLLSAIGDGLSIQAMVQPDHFDFRETLVALDVLLRHGLPTISRTAQEQTQSQ